MRYTQVVQDHTWRTNFMEIGGVRHRTLGVLKVAAVNDAAWGSASNVVKERRNAAVVGIWSGG